MTGATPAVARTPIGFVVWDERYESAYRGRIYTHAEAESVRSGIVWHSRDRYKVRPIALVQEDAHGLG